VELDSRACVSYSFDFDFVVILLTLHPHLESHSSNGYAGWDGAQTVPRVATYSPTLQQLLIVPATELGLLHTQVLVNTTVQVGSSPVLVLRQSRVMDLEVLQAEVSLRI
jgi:hypothetical protein